ncbi:hypothetical protein [Nocardioides deserti]|uniref:DUF2834 domain-containing protein n=1 Tax=Nocardioides deserti TaxID=1588644 RepID=A0ABR6UCV8_9ACTN|nr:hypothetical protein [Nocardioides deserti]MBC2962280.1 hypothetical protein [Nocardioides deserti]
MTTFLPESAVAPVRGPRTARSSAVWQPALAWVVSGALVLLSWSASVLMTIDGLVRAHDSALVALVEIGAAAVPATGGIALARQLHRLPAGGAWVWLGVLPSVTGWYFLAHLV